MPDAVRLASCSSTMDEARALARQGAPHGTTVVAATMTGGRGRRDHPWHAPEGGLYLSMVLRDIQDPQLLTLALGCAVAQTLEVVGVETGLKWVNDVVVDGRKVAGILVEGEATGGSFDFLVAGIGVNVNGHPEEWPAPLPAEATTVEAVLGVEQCLPDLEAFLIENMEDWIARVLEGRFDEIVAAWRQRDVLEGKDVVVDGERGTAQGIDDHGRLLVATDGGVRAFQDGTVHPA